MHEKRNTVTSDIKIQWHPGFYAAAELELSDNQDDLLFQTEHNLSRKPLQIDLLIIKKKKNISIKNEIGAIFRGYNIIEYKQDYGNNNRHSQSSLTDNRSQWSTDKEEDHTSER